MRSDTWDMRITDRLRRPLREAWLYGDQGWRGNGFRALTDYCWARRLGAGPRSVLKGLTWAARRMA
jgi:hypothetical protein